MKKLVLLLTVFMSACISNAQEAVDLGLSVKWANMDVGSTSPHIRGDLFAWGETETKEEFTRDNYFDLEKWYQDNTGRIKEKFKTFTSDKKEIGGTRYDVARLKWGGKWRLPTDDELYELRMNCKIVRVEFGLYKVTGPNGNSILFHVGGNGSSYYWSSTLNGASSAYALEIQGDEIRPLIMKPDLPRYRGCLVRPVMNFTKGESSYYHEKKDAEFEYILKSGTRNEKVLLARDYSIGNGVIKDNDKVVKLYKSLADAGEFDFKIKIAQMYETGKGLEKNFEKAAEAYFELANDYGNEDGINFLFKNLQQVISIPKLVELISKAYVPHGTYNNNYSWKMVCLWGACASGNLTAVVELADNFYAQKEIKPAIELYEKAAEDGSTDAMYKLGKIYLDSSSGGFMDIEKGIMWYTKAADSGHSDARLELGTFYKNGIHVKKDKKKAKMYLQ